MELKKRIATLVVTSTIAVVGFGAVAHADTNVQSSNSCKDCKTETGDSSASNGAAAGSGQSSVFGDNYQEGDNTADINQDAQANSGDGVPGQVIGVADGGHGDVNIIASNSCEDCKTKTGDAFANNGAIAFVGQTSIFGNNTQLGDNEVDMNQAAISNTGDGVTGAVIGVVTA